LLLSLLLLIALGTWSHLQPSVVIAFNNAGLSSLKYGGVEYLGFGDLRLEQAAFQPLDGPLVAGDVAGTTTVDAAARRVTRHLAWGSITVYYAASFNRLNMSVTVENRSAQTLQGIWLQPLGLQFPTRVREYDGNTPLLTNPAGQPAVVRLSCASGTVVLASEDGAKPVQIGFPWALDRPKNMLFPLSINTARVHSFPDNSPFIRRAIPAGQSDSFSLSLRFGPPGATTAMLAGDIYQEFAAHFPALLHWTDRRAIGALFLSTAATKWPTNQRGWLQDPKVDITTDSGVADLKRRVLTYADTSISILKKMNAQGMITWDIEGQEYPHAASYIGDPRMFETLAPEMSGIADEYFKRFRDAGLRVGVCIRPQRAVLASDRSRVTQVPVEDPTQLLTEKVLYAKKRWGITLFYVDSNVNADDRNAIDAGVFQRLAAAFPDVLFVPEHSQWQYYAYTAPYRELRQGNASTDSEIRSIYPDAFSVVYTADGPIDRRYHDLLEGVKHGDLLMFRGWFDDPQNTKDGHIYEQARQTALSWGITRLIAR